MTASTDCECSPHVVDESDLAEVFSLRQSTHLVKRGIAVGHLFLEATLDLAFLDDVEVITLVALVENVLARVDLLHLKAIDQFKFVVLLEALKKLDLVQVLEVDVSPADRVDSDDLLEDISGKNPSLTVISRRNRSSPLVVVKQGDLTEAY